MSAEYVSGTAVGRRRVTAGRVAGGAVFALAALMALAVIGALGGVSFGLGERRNPALRMTVHPRRH